MCGNRLNAWKTMPIRRRIRSTSTPGAVISSPSTTIRPGVDGLQQVDAAQQRGLAGARRPMRQTTSCSATARSMPRRTSSAPNDLCRPSIRSASAVVASALAPPCAPLRRSRATSQSVNRASGMVTTMKTSATARYGVKLKLAACLICACRKISTTPIDDTRTVSFWRPMKSLSSGGMTRRTACGTMTWRSDWKRLSPSDRAAASWLGMDRLDAGAIDLGHVRGVDQGQGGDAVHDGCVLGSHEPERRDAEPEDEDDEQARERPEDVGVDGGQHPDREEDRPGQAAEDGQHQPEDQDERPRPRGTAGR